MNIPDKYFYERNTLEVARELLGYKLYKKEGDKILSGIIVETEAYTQDDPACHAYKGRTKRAQTLFKDAGMSYVYFIYGMYHCFNIVTEPFDTAGAVLIRALEPVVPLENTNGPSKLCKQMNITREHNEIDLTKKSSGLWIEKGEKIAKKDIIQTMRIGISKAQDYPWRFYIKDNIHVSK